MTTQHEVALLRLVAQRLAGPRSATVTEAVRWLTAVQAQQLPGALTSVALRTADGARADVEAALKAGEVVRSWPMRGTLHLVAAEDLGWLLDLLAPRVLSAVTGRRTELGLDPAQYERALDLAVPAMSGGRGLRRRALLAVWEDGGLSTAGQRGAHLLGQLAQTGVICLGPMDGAEQLFVLTDEWIRRPRRLGRADALRELALRYFRGHGPATLADLARWAGLRITEARAGLDAARPDLASLTVDDTEYFLDPRTPDLLAGCRAEARGLFLLPGFDEFVLGYGDRGAMLDPRLADRIVPGGNGMFRSTVVHDGRIVGTWGWTGRGATRTVAATPFTSFPDAVTAAIPDAAAGLP
jgi:Winged helix DNA-binding domain